MIVRLVMMVGLGLFVDLDWGCFPLWLAALAVGALAFAALGLAIGGLTRDVRAASPSPCVLACRWRSSRWSCPARSRPRYTT